MKPRDKKPKCTAANKACGMACKPKAAICADQRKKLLANAKKGGLKGQAAKDYVQARIDRYRNLVSGKAGVDNKGAGGVGLDKKPTSTATRTTKMDTTINTPAQDPLKRPYNLDTVDTSQMEANLPSSYALNRGLDNSDAFKVSLGAQPSRIPILLETGAGKYKVMGGHDSYLAQRDAEKKYPNEVDSKQKVIKTKDKAEAKSMAEQRGMFNKYDGEGGWVSKEARNYIVDLGQVKLKKQQLTRFSKDEIDIVANKILESGKLVNFPVVTKTGVDDYSLKTGTLAYLAYSRAVELSQGRLPNSVMVWGTD